MQHLRQLHHRSRGLFSLQDRQPVQLAKEPRAPYQAESLWTHLLSILFLPAAAFVDHLAAFQSLPPGGPGKDQPASALACTFLSCTFYESLPA